MIVFYEMVFDRDESPLVFLPVVVFVSVSDFARRLVRLLVSPVELVSARAVTVTVAAFAVVGPGVSVRWFWSMAEATASVLVGSGFRNASQR